MNDNKIFENVAKLAVDRYDIQLQVLSFLAEETNILYKLSDQKGNQFLLKIFQDNSSSLEENLIEVHVMNLINEKGGISIPSILSAIDGSKIQEIKLDEDSTTLRVAIYSWLEGEDLDGNENDERFIQLGELTAKLHDATYGEHVPETFSPKRWDNVFYYEHDTVVYKDKKHQQYLSKEYHDIMDRMIPYLNKQLSAYYEMNEKHLQFIHSDLNPWNILVDGDEMHIIDFGDVLLGLPLHDIAILLYYYRYDEEVNFEDVIQLFFKGYEKIRPLPVFDEFDLDLLMIARRVNFLNYILVVSDEPSSFIEKSLPIVKDFIQKYELNI